MKNSIFSVLLFSLLAACAHPPQTLPTEANAANAANVPLRTEAPQPVLPAIELTDRLLYEFLLGDFAAQRGRPEIAARFISIWPAPPSIRAWRAAPRN